MLKSIWAGRWYWMLGILVFVIALVALVPLQFVWRYAEPYTQGLPVTIGQASGTIWQGNVRVKAPYLGNLDVDWQLSPASLLLAQLNVHFDVRGDEVSLSGTARANADQHVWLSDVQGMVSTKHLEPVLRPNRVSLAGDIELNNVAAHLTLIDKQILDASGRILFSGGDIGFPVDGEPIQATLPLLVGDIRQDNEKALIDINTREGEELGQAFLQQDGWGGVAIRRRFLDILGQTWPAEATVDTVIFEVSHKIL